MALSERGCHRRSKIFRTTDPSNSSRSLRDVWKAPMGPGNSPDGAHGELLLRYADLMTIHDITYDRNVLRNFWIAVRIKHAWRAMMYSLRSPTSPTRMSPEAFFTRTLLCTASSYIRYPGLLLRASAYRVLLAPMPESCTMKCALCLSVAFIQVKIVYDLISKLKKTP